MKSAARRNQTSRNYWGRSFTSLYYASKRKAGKRRKPKWPKIYERDRKGGGHSHRADR